jgi:hypothetical protein
MRGESWRVSFKWGHVWGTIWRDDLYHVELWAEDGQRAQFGNLQSYISAYVAAESWAEDWYEGVLGSAVARDAQGSAAD